MRRFWTIPTMREFRVMYPNTSNAALAAHFGRSLSGIKNMAAKLGVHKTAEARAKTRHLNAGWNRGMHYRPKGSEATQFKKGHRGPRQRPVGAERTTRDGIEVKVAEPSVWQPKTRVVWEKHFGQIPAGAVVRLIDGNQRNVTPGNLRLLTRAEHIRLNWKPRRPRRKPTSWAAPIAIGHRARP